jgi:hypothetical protein
MHAIKKRKADDIVTQSVCAAVTAMIAMTMRVRREKRDFLLREKKKRRGEEKNPHTT